VIKNIHKKLKIYGRLFDKKTGLNLDFSFGEMAMEIHELLGVTSTIKHFYQWKTNPRRTTLEAIQKWVENLVSGCNF